MQSLSVCMMVLNVEKTLPIALESLDGIYDDLIVVDGGSNDKTCEIAAQYKARIIYSEWPDNHSQQRNVYLQEVKTDWVFVIDSDEFIERQTLDFLKFIKLHGFTIGTDNFWIPRKWISPFSKNHYIAEPPHYPDFQRRLFKYHKGISYDGNIHEVIKGLKHPGDCLNSLNIYHLDLFLNSELKRQKKVVRYLESSSKDGLPHYYLPNIKSLNLKEWSCNEILPSVKKLLDNLPMKCKICESESHNSAKACVLGKYDINYFQCSNCGFVQTEEPYWLEEAYSDAIAISDVGLVLRNGSLSQKACSVIFRNFDCGAKFLDYGGGYGLFVRMMRDIGFDFFWIDKFCKNLFAKGFEFDSNASDSYELVTAFEVFEHFVNPLTEIEDLLKLSRNILFSTELLPETNPKPDEWWYYSLFEGQHVSIYTRKALSAIAEKYQLKLYSDNLSLHLLTEKELPSNLFDSLSPIEMQELQERSLLQSDYLKAISLLKSGGSVHLQTTVDGGDAFRDDVRNLRIVIDGVFFQLYQTGIARVWKSLLEEWALNGFAKHVVVLDRVGTAPKISHVNYRQVSAYDYDNTSADREMLQQVCDEEGAELFISTYYTTPLSTPSVFIAYDMIPEVMGWNLNSSMWREKHHAIQHASAYLAISENTAQDLAKSFSHISLESVKVAHCGVKSTFLPASTEEINSLRTKYGILKPYFILVGAASGYKNTILFFQAFAQLYSKQGFDIVCTGSGPLLETGFRTYTTGSVVHMLQFSDEELRTAYSGAVALVYPSMYEGFGLPVLEAIACGCPVITCSNASIPEVAGEAALYVDDNDVDGLTNALCDVQKPTVRNSLITVGLEQAKKFSWAKMAETVSSALIEATLLPLNLRDTNVIIFPDWSQPENLVVSDLARVIKLLASYSDRDYITLLVDTSNISEEDANLILSGVTMSLFMEEDLDATEGMEISLVGQLSQIQWSALLPHIQARIILERENEYMIAQLKAEQIPVYGLDNFTNIPQLLLNKHLEVTCVPPRLFEDMRELDNYHQRMQQGLDYLHSNILENPNGKLWQDAASHFTLNANFLRLYFTEANLREFFVKRAEIMQFSLEAQGYELDYSFSKYLVEPERIRLGIICDKLESRPEIYATLPLFKHLNRDTFEITVYVIGSGKLRLERYFSGHADALVQLPNNLERQVNNIRSDRLDIVFFATNVTSKTNLITLLALHRLAPIQVVGMNTPVTTGMRNIDYYISGELTEPEKDAQQQYTETLVTLNGPAQCFDFATEEQLVATISISREKLGIEQNAIVYISGANYQKITPELEAAWAKIIAAVPNSRLMLYPFNPNWSPSYADLPFEQRLVATFARHGLGKDRFNILTPVPNHADVKEYLRLGDIYLDSYPYSGMTSLVDPLKVGLPIVVRQGNSSRSRMGASLLRELQIPDLITESEEAYIQLAVVLGTDSKWRKKKSEEIKQSMQKNPRFLDSYSYSAQVGSLFQNLYQNQSSDAMSHEKK